MYRNTVPTRPVTFAFPHEPATFQAVDFAAVLPVSTCEDPECLGCDDCATSWWTPRTADLLHGVAECLRDLHLDLTGLDDFDPAAPASDYPLEDLLNGLPRTVAAAAGPQWAARFLGCYTDLMHRMEDGEVPRPRCTAEEMALHLILDQAQARLDDLGVEDARSPHEEMLHYFLELQNDLPRTPMDYDIHMLRAALFEDDDVLMLFDPALDGIELDEELTAAMGLSHLQFDDWFTPFRDDAPVPPLNAGHERPSH